MIVGIGVDIVHDEQLPDGVLLPDDSFFRRTFTEREWELARQRRCPEAFLRGRFAAKEAVFKALGVSPEMLKRWDDIEVTSDDDGVPRVVLHGAVGDWAQRRGINLWHVSLSSDRDCHVAFCVAERCDSGERSGLVA